MTHAAPGPIEVSILVPAKDEAENLPLFMEQAAAAFQGSPITFEVVVVDDGSTDETWQVLLTPVSYTHLTLPTTERV